MTTYKGNFAVKPYMITDGKINQKLPDIIEGNFYCAHLNLTTLEGCPKIVKKSFTCSNNLLTNLKGCPEEVIINFNCSNNLLTSLEGCPYKVESFYANSNNLTSLKGGPKIVSGSLIVIKNKLKSLEYGPIFKGPDIHAYDNLNNLSTEIRFLEDREEKNAHFFGIQYWHDLATYIIEKKLDFDSVKGWPKNFDLKSIKTSAKLINKFNL